MIQQGIDAIKDAIDARLFASLASMPGPWSLVFSEGAKVSVFRTTLDPKDEEKAPTGVGVRVEQQDAATLEWPLEASESSAYELQVGVTCWIARADVPGLKNATTDDMCSAVRALCRAVDHAIRSQFAPLGIVELEGVQVRCPSRVTYGEPEFGEDESLTLMTLSLSVPVFDSWALSAGSV